MSSTDYLYIVRYYITNDYTHLHSDLIDLIEANFLESKKIEDATWLIETHLGAHSLFDTIKNYIENDLNIPNGHYRMYVGNIPKQKSKMKFHLPRADRDWIDERVLAP